MQKHITWGKGMRILVVEDEEMIRDYLVDVVESEGHKVVEASNGQEGLDKFKKHGNFDLIVSDVQMPEMSGIEMMKQIKLLSDVRLVFVTGCKDELLMDTVDTNVRIFTKPLNLDEFFTFLSSLEEKLQSKARKRVEC